MTRLLSILLFFLVIRADAVIEWQVYNECTNAEVATLYQYQSGVGDTVGTHPITVVFLPLTTTTIDWSGSTPAGGQYSLTDVSGDAVFPTLGFSGGISYDNIGCDTFPETNTPPCETNVTFTVQNNGITSRTFYVADAAGDFNSIPGDAGISDLPPGSSHTFNVFVPCANASAFQVFSHPDALLSDNTPETTNNVDTYSNDVPANAPETSASGSPAPPTLVTPPTPDVYNPTNNGNSNSASPIVYTSPATNALQADVQQGDSALYDAVVKNGVQNHADLSALAGIDSTGFAGVIGAINGETNGGGWTNGLTLSQLSNYNNGLPATWTNTYLPIAVAQIEAATSAAASLNPNLSSSLTGLPSTPEADSGDGGDEQDIDLGHGIVIRLGTGIPSFLNIKELIEWCCFFGLFYMNFRTLISAVRHVMETEQATTATSVIPLADSASAIAMASFIVAAAAVLPAIAATALSGEVGLFASTTNVFSDVFGFGYNVLEAYIPFVTIFTCITSRLVFVVFIESASVVAQGIVKFLVGL